MIESEYLKKIINKKLQHLILRGARTTVISDTQILIEDIEEWLSKDARIIQNASNIHIAFDVYSKADYQGGGAYCFIKLCKKIILCGFIFVFSVCSVLLYFYCVANYYQFSV